MRILKLRLGSLFGENHPPFRSYWSLSILRGVPVQLYIRLEPRCCTCIKVRDRTVAGRWWWCALNDYLAIAQFVRGHRSAGNNLSCHQMFRSVTIHLKWIFFSHFQTLCKKSGCICSFSKDKFLQENAAADKFYHKTVATFYLFGSNSDEQVTRCKVVHQKDWKGFQEQMRRQLEPAVSEYLVSKFQPKQPLSRVLEHFIHGEKWHQKWIGRGNLHSVRVIIITCNTRLQKIIQNHQLTDGK